MSTGACASASIAWRGECSDFNGSWVRSGRICGGCWTRPQWAVEEVHAVTSAGVGKAVDIAGHFYTSGEAGEYVLVRDFNAAAKRAGADTTVVSLESLGYTKRQKKIEGKNEYVIQGIRLC
jgi:hypothetical protein